MGTTQTVQKARVRVSHVPHTVQKARVGVGVSYVPHTHSAEGKGKGMICTTQTLQKSEDRGIIYTTQRTTQAGVKTRT